MLLLALGGYLALVGSYVLLLVGLSRWLPHLY